MPVDSPSSNDSEGVAVCACRSVMSCSQSTVCDNKDAQVITVCRQLGYGSERWLNINVDIINMYTVLITWKLLNSSPHWPSSYVVDCFSMGHRIKMPVNNATFSVQPMGLIPGTSYNCCVSAVYESYIHNLTYRGTCTEEYVTIHDQPSSDKKLIFIVGGVLGFIIAILVVLLAICGVILLYTYLPRRPRSVIPAEG